MNPNNSYIWRRGCGETELCSSTIHRVDEAEYVDRAKARIRDILNAEHAVVRLELEARISEAYFPEAGLNIDPHHITTAYNELLRQGEIIKTEPEATRGQHPVETIQPANQHRRKTAITQAAGRKRLLYGRYLGWAQETKRYQHGLIGPAGERAVRSGLLESQNFIPVRPDAAEVKRLLGVDLPGPPDSAGYVLPLDKAGIPGPAVTVLVEVKNIRSQIYPHSEEPYQLLYKAHVLQKARPDQPILPVLVCRKAHRTLFWMAKQLGFFVIEMKIQYAGALNEKELDEVRNELHFHDLRAGDGPSVFVRDRFRDTIPRYALEWAAKWQQFVANPELAQYVPLLREETNTRDRGPLMAEFRDQVKRAGYQGF